MELYTEEEVITAIRLSDNRSIDEVLAGLTPIKLPFNEIEYLSNQTEVLPLDYIDGFLDGAWWVKDKIQNGNNE